MTVRSLRNAGCCAEIVDRVRCLEPDSHPSWGTMDPARAITHLADALRLAFAEGEVHTSDSEAPFASNRREWIHEWQWPEGRAQSPPEGLTTDAGVWEEDLDALLDLIDRLAAATPQQLANSHPLFGTMSEHDWAVLMYRHTDHHLRQFGV